MKAALLLTLWLATLAAGEWQVLYPNVMAVALGCSAANDNEVFVSGGENSGGGTILKSVDGGDNWSRLSHDFQLMYMSIDVNSFMSGVAGVLGFYKQVAVGSYTTDGESFFAAPFTPLFSAAQSVGTSGQGEMFIVGGWIGAVRDDWVDGIISTVDGGETVSFHPWTGETTARYGSFPDNQTWYISGGTWPTEESETLRPKPDGPFVHHLNSHVKVVKDGLNRASFQVNPRPKAASGYAAVIQKTVDGGKTFQTVFNGSDYYFNGIDCIDVDTCWVTAEGVSGARILHTNDGGRVWVEQAHVVGDFSLLDVEMVNANEGWAVGAELLSNTFNALFMRTVNGGKTWTMEETIPNAYPNSITVPSSKRAYATAFLRNGLSSILGFK